MQKPSPFGGGFCLLGGEKYGNPQHFAVDAPQRWTIKFRPTIRDNIEPQRMQTQLERVRSQLVLRRKSDWFIIGSISASFG